MASTTKTKKFMIIAKNQNIAFHFHILQMRKSANGKVSDIFSALISEKSMLRMVTKNGKVRGHL